MAIKSLDNDTDRVTRQPRTMDALEATYGVDDDKPDVVIEVEAESGADKADAAAEALAQRLRDTDAELARSRAETVEARRAAAESGATVVNAAHRAVAERAANIDSAIEARNQTIESAEGALKAAMDVNDPVAMSKANRAIARAEAEIVQLERDKGEVENDKLRLKNAPAPRQQQEQKGPSPESLAWIRAHPRWNSDPEYQAAVKAADNAYLTQYGWDNYGKKHYVDFVESTMTDRFGEGHGNVARNGKQPAARTRPASSTAARADAGSDAGDGAGNGALTFKHAGGSISLKRTGDGKETVSGKIPAAWVDAAKWAGFKQGDSKPGGGKYKTDAEGAHAYAIEQMHILEEQRGGSNAGLQFGEGGVMH